MALARWQASMQDAAGNVLPGATVEVRDEATGLLALLFSDRDGEAALGNPFAADANGFAAFFTAGGAYRIMVTSGSEGSELRYVGIGLLSEADEAEPPAGTLQAANNLADVANAPTAFANIKQAATTAASGVVQLADGAAYRVLTLGRAITTDAVAAGLAEVALADAATIVWNMAAGIDFTVTLAGNRTLGNPSNVTVGKRGRIRVVQDATGGRTLAKSSNCKTAGGQALALSTAPGAVDYIDYDAVSATNIRLALSKAWA